MQRRHIYGAGIAIVGLFLAVVQIYHGAQQSPTWLIFTFEAGPFVLVALTLPYAGYWLATRPAYEQDITRILAWGVGGVVLFVSVGALLLFGQRVFLGTLERASYVAMDHVTVGAVVGVLVGLYDAQGRRRRRELQQERNRVESFANKAADVNNYGRALNRSDSVDEVSALCIQAMQTLLGVSEVALLTFTDESVDVVDDTILNVSTETLATLGERARGQERATVVTHDDVPGEIGDRAESVLSLEITAIEGTSFVLVALAPADAIFADEDGQLMELLASHSGTAIDSIHAEANRQPEPRE